VIKLAASPDISGRLRPPAWADKGQLTDRAYDQITDTTIDLLRTPRADGDLVSYRPSITVDGAVALAGAPVNLRIVRTGWRVDVSGGAFFVRPTDFVEGKESEFSPVPAVTTAIHYRFGRTDGHAIPSAGARFYNFVDPGLGLHGITLALGEKTEQDGAEEVSDASLGIGIGATLQLFGDVLQAGVGYDFQAGRGYTVIGIGLKTLTDFGITFPGVPAPTGGEQ
jgi:hypothetical protein